MTDASVPANGTDYSYTFGGKLASRTWTRWRGWTLTWSESCVEG